MTDPIAYEQGQRPDGTEDGYQMDVYECIAQVEADHLAGVAAAADKAAESHDWTEWSEDSLTLESYLAHKDDEGYTWDYELAGAPDDDDFTFLPRDYDRLEV